MKSLLFLKGPCEHYIIGSEPVSPSVKITKLQFHSNRVSTRFFGQAELIKFHIRIGKTIEHKSGILRTTLDHELRSLRKVVSGLYKLSV